MVARGGIEPPTRGLAGGEAVSARGARKPKNLTCLIQDATPGGLELAPVGPGMAFLSSLFIEDDQSIGLLRCSLDPFIDRVTGIGTPSLFKRAMSDSLRAVMR